jgi:protoporphyrinogen/coproporphyrinogen III oxidase
MSDRPHVVVIGGGIAGLAAAHALHRGAGDSIRVTVLEQADAVGGKLRLGSLGGVTVDLGAESVLARRPEAVRLAERVGLSARVVQPSTSRASIWTRGRLRPLPRGQLMGIPVDLRELAASEVLSLKGLARIPWDSVLPSHASSGDRALGPYVASRVGREVVDRLVEPLLGGVYAGHADQLSLDAVLPQLAGAVRVERSLLRGARQIASSVPGALPEGTAVFAGLSGGVGQLPGAVAEASGATVMTRHTVHAIERTSDGWRVTVGGPDVVAGGRRGRLGARQQIDADAIVMAVPAAPAARLLDDVAAAAADELRAVPYASVGIVTLLVERSTVGDLPAGSGFLVPPVDRRLIKAATFSSQKWAWTGAERPDLHVLRASVGRYGDSDDLQRSDEDLVAAVLDDLAAAIGWSGTAAPTEWAVTRWGGALPQYLVGHLDRVGRVRSALREVSGLVVCGAAYDGVGVPACIASGESAAGQVLRELGARRQWGYGIDTSEPGTGSG